MQRKNEHKIKRLTFTKRKKLSDEWEASTLTQAEFCKRKNISLNSFVYWRSTVLQEMNKTQTTFLPANITAPTVKQATCSGAILKLPNGISLQILPNTDKAFLKDVLELLGVILC